MGFMNPRAKCPNCGGKIHTGAMGLSSGKECQWCGTPLTGKVLFGEARAASSLTREQAEMRHWELVQEAQELEALKERGEIAFPSYAAKRLSIGKQLTELDRWL